MNIFHNSVVCGVGSFTAVRLVHFTASLGGQLVQLAMLQVQLLAGEKHQLHRRCHVPCSHKLSVSTSV